MEEFEKLSQSVPPKLKKTFEGFPDYAVRHRRAIERFARFPHRNAVLGRPSTPEELKFLAGPDAPF